MTPTRAVAHPRVVELLRDDLFWDCVDEAAPFGSDEGAQAYSDYVDWRDSHSGNSVVSWLESFVRAWEPKFDEHLAADEVIASQLAAWEASKFDFEYQVFTIDTTIIATALAQLTHDGAADPGLKPYVRIALARQLHPLVIERFWGKSGPRRQTIMQSVAKAFDMAWHMA